ncbi:hypothetical protein STCU_10900 [Strigomonas culicis]|uniref:Uncharacterized protein n=1 Tax=Strigomonas culicis TaxID=28005 RepID=S9UQN5_9TRYP|nr:hypothetical protein STCU_10900 [Strigomonas culicis]|eukprot:EPY16956.1 hypothetical protein STCU_10900 [Strigomonas culicis]
MHTAVSLSTFSLSGMSSAMWVKGRRRKSPSSAAMIRILPRSAATRLNVTTSSKNCPSSIAMTSKPHPHVLLYLAERLHGRVGLEAQLAVGGHAVDRVARVLRVLHDAAAAAQVLLLLDALHERRRLAGEHGADDQLYSSIVTRHLSLKKKNKEEEDATFVVLFFFLADFYLCDCVALRIGKREN